MRRNFGLQAITVYRFMMFSFFAFAVSAMLITEAYALPYWGSLTSGGMGDVLCFAESMINGSLGKGLATLVIVMLGIGAMFGKVSWGLVTLVGVGIAVTFGAYTIATMLASQFGFNFASCTD
jgi:type IV secretory pathway VirB2 component (pilin)